METKKIAGQDLLGLKRAAWRSRAIAQGLVCFVCGEAPSLERRPEFYDTGLCAACAEGDLPPPALKAGRR